MNTFKNKKMFKKIKKQENLFVASFLVYPLILFAVFYVGVNINSIFLSFQKYDFLNKMTWVEFENFENFIKNIAGADVKMAIGFINSIKMYFINLVICLPLYILLSYILFKKCFMNKTLRIIVMIPQIISGFVMCLVFKKFIGGALPDMMTEIFKIEKFPKLLTDPRYCFGTCIFYMIWISFSVSLIVYPNAMNEIDDGILEAANLDGVGNIFQELRYIILPLIYPTITTFLITGFAGIMTNPGCVPTFYMYSAPIETFNIGYYYWSTVATSKLYAGYPELAAGGLMMTAVIAPLTLLIKKLLEKYGPETDI